MPNIGEKKETFKFSGKWGKSILILKKRKKKQFILRFILCGIWCGYEGFGIKKTKKKGGLYTIQSQWCATQIKRNLTKAKRKKKKWMEK